MSDTTQNCVENALGALDCISRQAVDELSKELVHTTRDKADFLCNFWEELQKLPPVNPQESKTDVLDKIRAKIEQYEADCLLADDSKECKECDKVVFGTIYRIIDKYKAESEKE